MNNRWISIVLLLLALCLGFYFYNKYRVPPTIRFAGLKLTDMQGRTVLFESLKGRKVVLCFSATWCPNCWEELQTINEIKTTELSDVDVVVISDEPLEKMAKFEQRLGNAFTYWHLQQSFSEIGVNTLPTSYILNKNLEVKKETVGYIDWKDPSTLEHLKTLMQ